MKTLISKIESLKKTELKQLIDSRLKSFQKNSDEDVFKELCFCLMTANFNAKKAIEIQKSIDNDFLRLNEQELSLKLKKYGHRFPNMRAKYISQAQRLKNFIKQKVESFSNRLELREWLVNEIKGLGMKEASHFLRNIGYLNYAILDFHIIDLMTREGLIIRPKNLNKKNYLLIENELEKLCKKVNLSQGELDFYLWFIETGTVLK